MRETNENSLEEFRKRFKIAEGLPASEHIKILQTLEKLPRNKRIVIINYFLTVEKNPAVLSYLVKLTNKIENNLTFDILIDIFLSNELEDNEDTRKLKCEITKIIGKPSNNEAVIPLLYVLNNKNEHYLVRLACAEALGKIGSSYAVSPLIEVMQDNEEKSVYLKESAAKALGMLGDIRAIDPLVNVLETKNGLFNKFTFLKERVIEALGKLGNFEDEKSIKGLKAALSDEAVCIRCGAIEALSEINNEKVIPLIENMLNDESEEVLKTAIFALYDICGSEYLKNLVQSGKLNEKCVSEINSILNEDGNEVRVEK